eukprot:GHVT01009105.1.p1 GENE.GHVT01009105.1~~GHVT01009105.1.p1  ORF type:complete len:135 (+),score=26.88 GHVT01009105.1:741-1145(+)
MAACALTLAGITFGSSSFGRYENYSTAFQVLGLVLAFFIVSLVLLTIVYPKALAMMMPPVFLPKHHPTEPGRRFWPQHDDSQEHAAVANSSLKMDVELTRLAAPQPRHPTPPFSGDVHEPEDLLQASPTMPSIT